MNRHHLALIIAAVLLLDAAGCSFRKAKVSPPPAPPPPAQEKPPSEPIEPPQTPARPAHSDIKGEEAPEAITPGPALPPRPPAPARRTARPKPAPKPRAENDDPVKETAQPAVAEQPPIPQLGEVLSRNDREKYFNSYRTASTEVRSTLARIGSRDLTQDQAETLVRVRSFIKQAEEASETDVRNAARLAERAAVLVRELLKNLQ